MAKKRRRRRNRGLILLVSLLIIVVFALTLVLGAVYFYKQNGSLPFGIELPFLEETPFYNGQQQTDPAVEDEEELPKTTAAAEKAVIKIPDITNAPDPSETKEEPSSEEITTSEAVTEEVREQMKLSEYISYVNKKTIETAGSKVTDLTEWTEVSADRVLSMIESYYAPEQKYLDGNARSDGDFSDVIARRNLIAVKDPITLRYGILTQNVSLRSFPTWLKASDSTSSDSADYLQETLLMEGQGVVILHQTEDQVWSFVQSEFYYGWIQTSAIGFCDYETMCGYIESDCFAVITSASVEIGGSAIRMGTRLAAKSFDEENGVILLPQQDESGKLTTLEVTISRDYISEGWLELSEEALAEQAKKLVNTSYGRGDSNGYMDAASVLRAVYNCFGIILPRNTANITKSGLKTLSLEDIPYEEKLDIIKALPIGSILTVNGHVMMYIGEVDGVPSVLHAITRYLPSKNGQLEEPGKCVITPVEIFNSSGVSYVDLIRSAVVVEWEWIIE